MYKPNFKSKFIEPNIIIYNLFLFILNTYYINIKIVLLRIFMTTEFDGVRDCITLINFIIETERILKLRIKYFCFLLKYVNIF